MKILTISTLYPNAVNPRHGIFVETRLRQLKKHYPDIRLTVIAPVPWFPLSHPIFGRYSEFASVPLTENRFGIQVYHPRYLVIPKIGMYLTPTTLAYTLKKQIRKMMQQGFDFDLIDGHYYYPDGVAITEAAKTFNKPFTVTARGTDINLLPTYPSARKRIQQVMTASHHNLAVCDALRTAMIDLGAEPNRVSTLRNGVDLDLFSFNDEEQQQLLRKALGLPLNIPIVLSVGLLIERKGHHLVIEALRQLPTALLLIAGSGPQKKTLSVLARKYGVTDRVRFLGRLSQEELSAYYGAASVLTLASDREGWANVLLESMACGTPVVATNIWGTPEVVRQPRAGKLVERDALAIAKGIQQLLDNPFPRAATRQYAEQFDWSATSEGQYQLFNQLIRKTS
ncbi:glycosyltransferase family 4 protein [Photobacterium galatheae]|uniref:Glycosyl transferase family 1 n=1 Tax=Photobacterium galatheae TaxID=1654360 RepID=A0A066RKA7_9GAMM|nr:glycosyltransferase family 4 protein [Photobacterium galatheae]KDM90749.1 glycosyl transferase family 1 [Photobacterium galatheae]MCM0149922.1 glycosyltransferase family 4 protein [Photobacterium galatheae]